MSDTYESLEDHLEQVFKKNARTIPATLQNIKPTLELFSSENWTEKQLTRAILRIAASYRTRGQYGRLGAAVLFASALLGKNFITRAGRSGLFICDEMPLEKFRNFLKYLVEESESIADDSLRVLARRLRTYLIYCKLFEVTSRSTDKTQKLLRTSPRKVIKCVLSLSQLHFLNKMELQIPLGIGELLDQYGTPEELTSIISLIVATANKFKPLDSFDFAFSVAPDINGDDVLRVLELGNALQQRYEIAKDISLFGYDLELREGNDNKQIFYLRPPSNEFEHAIRLGYIRSELGLSKAQIDPKKQAGRAMSILGFAELVVAQLGNEIYERRDPNTPHSRIVFKFPASQELYKIILKGGFYEDLVEQERFSQDFMIPVSRKGAPELQLTDTLNLSAFFKIWRLLHFFCVMDICVLRSLKKIDSTTLFNSLVRVFKEEDLFELIASVDVDREQIKEFLRLVSANVEHLGFLDLQYRPFLKIASATKGNITSPAEIIHVPALVSFANILRNVQSANQLRLKQNAELFVEAVAFNLTNILKR